jgi:hypothetical protein
VVTEMGGREEERNRDGSNRRGPAKAKKETEGVKTAVNGIREVL